MIEGLKKKYPNLYKNLTSVVINKGWNDILHKTSEELEKAVLSQEEPELYYCTNVNSKLGSLHFSMTNSTYVIRNILNEAALLSQSTCEICSGTGVIRSKGDDKSVICDKCFEEILYK